jgi:hypothetical protein
LGALVKLNEAVKAFKSSQAELDAVKEARKLNDAARKVLGDHMLAKGINAYRGISMRVVEYDAWDDAALRAHLDIEVKRFRIKRPRRYFDLIVSRRKAATPAAPESAAAA